ncbi:MAG: hypothetical protein IPP14_06295 [Planctomycetes bacterium]|nr:hypothetical protein [Planctomycetota bacterium]
MKALITILFLLLVAACGTANQQPPANAGNEPAHDHFHSHAGQAHSLGTQKLGPTDVAATLMDHVNRGGTTQFELQLSDASIKLEDLLVEIVDATGKRVVALGLHGMAKPGQFGAHAGLPADAPKGLKLRVGQQVGGQAVTFEIPE